MKEGSILAVFEIPCHTCQNTWHSNDLSVSTRNRSARDFFLTTIEGRVSTMLDGDAATLVNVLAGMALELVYHVIFEPPSEKFAVQTPLAHIFRSSKTEFITS